MNLDPLARRVARRHAIEGTSPRIEFSGGHLSAIELAKRLEPTTGRLKRLMFHQSSPNTVGWAAVDPNDGVVAGTLQPRVSVTVDAVTLWAEVMLDPPGSSVVVDLADLVFISSATTTSAVRHVAIEYQRRTRGLA